eukprot:gene4638-27789_t
MFVAVIVLVCRGVGVPSADPTCGAGCNCTKGIDIQGGNAIDIKFFPAATAAACCSACSYDTATPCTAWTWNGAPNGACYLKRTNRAGTYAAANAVSGIVLSRPQPPVPHPRPPPPAPPACTSNCTWLDPTIPTVTRVSALVAALTLDEKIALMGTNGAAVPRLKLPSYAWWSEGAHGVAWAGVATVFPALVGVGSSFDP